MLSTDRFIREKECQQLTGLSRSCRYRLEKAGQFPSRRKLGGRSVGWSLSEVSGMEGQPRGSSLIRLAVHNRHSSTNTEI
ncbi:AlpA family transcriptional regulator [Escherichia coli]|nr:AlpA family transcriptional regulator [Escherichia coli]